MSSKVKEKMQVSYLHKIIERLLIFAVISTFIFCVLSFLTDIARANNKNFFSIFTFIAVLITQIISFSVIAIYFSEKSKVSNFLRFFVFYIIILGVILFFTSRWVSSPIVFIATAIQTILYYKVFAPFFEHDCFEEQCTAKNNTKLQKELYDYNMHLTQSAEGYKQNRAMFVILGLILAILAGLSLATDIQPSVFSITLFITYFVCAGSHFFLYGYYVREASLASNGFSNVFNFRLKTIGTSVIIFFFCFLAGILVSSNHSPLKLYYLLYFFKLFKGKPVDTTPPTADTAVQEYERRLEEIRAFTASANDTDTKSSYIFAICCGLFLILGIAWFFLKPFVSKKFYEFVRKTDLKGKLKRFFLNLKKYIKNIFKPRIKHSFAGSRNARSFINEMESFLQKSKKSKEKRAELDRLSRVFVKLIDWGEEHNIPYTKNLAPAEYTALFKNKNADIAGLLFEQALYAKEPLSTKQEDDFNKAVQKVVNGS